MSGAQSIPAEISTDSSGNEVHSGASSSYIVTNCKVVVLLPHASVAVHSRIHVPGHPPENNNALMLYDTAPQLSVATNGTCAGSSASIKSLQDAMVNSEWFSKTGAVVSTTSMV